MTQENLNLTTEQQLDAVKELYRLSLLASQNNWLVERISKQIPELDISVPSPEAGWLWTYRCTEQESDSCETAMDALLDFIKTQLDLMDESLSQDDNPAT